MNLTSELGAKVNAVVPETYEKKLLAVAPSPVSAIQTPAPTAFHTEAMCTKAFSGVFGQHAEEYAAARPKHPQKPFDVLKTLVPLHARTLDVGCGTGLSSEQLAENGFKNVIGLDRDESMLRQAAAKNPHKLEYILGDVTKGLPFANESCKVVTALSCIHWFADPQSIDELLRVIEKGGFLVTVRGCQKYDIGIKETLKPKVKEIVQKTLGVKLEKGEENDVNPKSLEARGFKIVINETIPAPASFTKDGFKQYLKTYSFQHYIDKALPEKQREVAEQIDKFLDTQVKDGKIEINNPASFVVFQKPLD